jgi:hypothetical protein
MESKFEHTVGNTKFNPTSIIKLKLLQLINPFVVTVILWLSHRYDITSNESKVFINYRIIQLRLFHY